MINGQAAQDALGRFATYIWDWRTANRGASIILWVVGAWATAQFFIALGLPQPWDIVGGIAAQYILTVSERPLWRFGQKTKLALIAVILDVIFNAGGLWIYLRNLGNTSTWQMLAEVTGADVSPTALTRFVLALVIGLVTAAGSDILWHS